MRSKQPNIYRAAMISIAMLAASVGATTTTTSTFDVEDRAQSPDRTSELRGSQPAREVAKTDLSSSRSADPPSSLSVIDAAGDQAIDSDDSVERAVTARLATVAAIVAEAETPETVETPAVVTPQPSTSDGVQEPSETIAASVEPAKDVATSQPATRQTSETTTHAETGTAAGKAADTATETAERSAEPDTADSNETVARAERSQADGTCTSSFCPSGIGLEPTEISYNGAVFVFFPIQGATPTFTLERSRPADRPIPLPRLSVEEGQVIVAGMTIGTEYVLTADRDFGFDAGSTSETIYFQTLSQAKDRYCDQIEIDFEDNKVMQREGELYSSVSPLTLDRNCVPYHVWLHSTDVNHVARFQPYQLNEQWVLEVLDDGGEVLYRSPVPPDLDETEIHAYNLVDTIGQIDATAARAFHVGEGNVNSVEAGATLIPNNPNPRTPSLCHTLDVLFINPTLVNGVEDADRVSVQMPVPEDADRRYQIWLYSSDDGHGDGERTQHAEQWFVEGLDADGNVVYRSPTTPDLPDDQVLNQVFAGTVTLDNIVSFQAKHLGRGGLNSVEASMMLVPVDVSIPDEAYPLWCKRLNLQRP